MLFVLPRQVKKACERPPSAQEARPAGHSLCSEMDSCFWLWTVGGVPAQVSC